MPGLLNYSKDFPFLLAFESDEIKALVDIVSLFSFNLSSFKERISSREKFLIFLPLLDNIGESKVWRKILESSVHRVEGGKVFFIYSAHKSTRQSSQRGRQERREENKPFFFLFPYWRIFAVFLCFPAIIFSHTRAEVSGKHYPSPRRIEKIVN